MLKEASGSARDSAGNARQLFDLTGRVAIVTGGSIGLGRQMAEGLAEMGAHVVLCARKQERCQEAAEELQRLGAKAIALGCDVKNPASIQEMVDATLSQFGQIDILINNAGISWGAPVEEMRLEDWNKVIETNLTGTFLCAQAVGKVMIRQGRGKILNIASVAGLGGAPPELPAIGYHASKGGVISFTKDLACKWAVHNIQVNAIAPGIIETDQTSDLDDAGRARYSGLAALNRLGRPDEIANAVLFLASDSASFISGVTLNVDGGI